MLREIVCIYTCNCAKARQSCPWVSASEGNRGRLPSSMDVVHSVSASQPTLSQSTRAYQQWCASWKYLFCFLQVRWILAHCIVRNTDLHVHLIHSIHESDSHCIISTRSGFSKETMQSHRIFTTFSKRLVSFPLSTVLSTSRTRPTSQQYILSSQE